MALEAALLFPIAVILLLGFSETYFYMRAVSIAERVTFAVADMVAKRVILFDCSNNTDSSFLGTHLYAAQLMAQPLSLGTHGTVIVSAVVNSGNGAEVAWQRRSSHLAPGAVSVVGSEGRPATLPGTLTVRPVAGTGADTLIVAEFFYVFRPFAGIRSLIPSLPGEVTISRQAYSRARLGSLVILATVNGCTPLPKP